MTDPHAQNEPEKDATGPGWPWYRWPAVVATFCYALAANVLLFWARVVMWSWNDLRSFVSRCPRQPRKPDDR